MRGRLILVISLLLGLAVSGSYADISAIWNGFEAGNVEAYNQDAGVAPVISGVTIDTSSEVKHSGAVSLKVDNFTLPSTSTTTTSIGVIDNGSTVYWWHWCVNYNTLFIWVYIPPANWNPDLVGEYTVIIGGTRYYGDPTPLTSGWNYLSIDAASTKSALAIPETSQYATWLGARITNMSATTTFSGPIYLDDEGGAVPDGIWHMHDFETSIETYYDLKWTADTIYSLTVSSTQKQHGDASLAIQISLPYDATNTTSHKSDLCHASTPAYNLLPYVGMRAYLYLPNPPPTTGYVKMFSRVGVDWKWRFETQPNIQQGWNILGFDLSTCVNVGYPSFSRMHIDVPGLEVGKSTTAAWADTIYYDDVQAVPAIQASISDISFTVGSMKDLSSYIEYGLPFNPFPGVYNWISSNTTVVTVGATSGIATGVAVGTATITASDRTGMTADITVNVVATNAPLAIEPGHIIIQKKEQFSPLFD